MSNNLCHCSSFLFYACCRLVQIFRFSFQLSLQWLKRRLCPQEQVSMLLWMTKTSALIILHPVACSHTGLWVGWLTDRTILRVLLPLLLLFLCLSPPFLPLRLFLSPCLPLPHSPSSPSLALPLPILTQPCLQGAACKPSRLPITARIQSPRALCPPQDTAFRSTFQRGVKCNPQKMYPWAQWPTKFCRGDLTDARRWMFARRLGLCALPVVWCLWAIHYCQAFLWTVVLRPFPHCQPLASHSCQHCRQYQTCTRTVIPVSLDWRVSPRSPCLQEYFRLSLDYLCLDILTYLPGFYKSINFYSFIYGFLIYTHNDLYLFYPPRNCVWFHDNDDVICLFVISCRYEWL